ncbi:O-antigen ligase family protein [Sutcliffiella halmapala]|uniref:O-antigen ligase family protein n=1 Tax=Sutcliffiella halmapala TaxID=79882 RepID=UPI0009956495|nr:O-antigen ligase family protein [Sutcliffiella halmapala]
MTENKVFGMKESIWFIVIIAALIFKPSPGLLLGENSIIGFTLITIFLATLLLIGWSQFAIIKNPISYMQEQRKDNYIFLYIIITAISFIISTVYGMITVPDKTKVTDFLELYRYACYAVFFLLAKEVTAKTWGVLLKAFLVMVAAFEVFGILQFLDLFNVNDTIGQLYTISQRHYNMIIYQHRIPSTFLNPNMYGSFLIIVAAILVALLTYMKTTKWRRIGIYTLLLLTFISVLLTTSRTAVIAVGGIVVYWIILSIIVNRHIWKRQIANGLIVLLMFLVVAASLVPQIAYLDYAATQIFSTYQKDRSKDKPTDISKEEMEEQERHNAARESLESVSSFKNRYDYWVMNYEEFLESPVIGHGPMRSNFVSFADNTYLYILARYGAVGMLVFLSFVLYGYFKTIMMLLKPAVSGPRKTLAIAINLILVGYLVMGMVSEVWYNLQAMTFLFVLFGLMLNKKLPD